MNITVIDFDSIQIKPERLAKFKEMGKAQLTCYAQCHGFPPIHPQILLIMLAQSEYQPVEGYLDLLFEKPDEIDERTNQVIDSLGIVIPPEQECFPYLIANLHSYNNMLAIPSTPEEDQAIRDYQVGDSLELEWMLERYTDSDLFQLLGVYMTYCCRDELIDKLLAFMEGSCFFVRPLSPNCTNKETYLGTDTASVPLIGYGCYKNYRGYEEDELLMNIAIRNNRLRASFPGGGVFSRKQLEELYELVKYCPEFSRLSQLLEQGLAFKLPDNRTIKRDFSNADKDLVKEFLTNVFYAGMAMRRWTGGPFPHKEEETLGETDPDLLTTHYLNAIKDCYDRADQPTRELLDDLSLHARKPLGETLMDRYQIVCRSDSVDACIRINSGLFILTADHYLRLLFSYSIPGFNRKQLERIS